MYKVYHRTISNINKRPINEQTVNQIDNEWMIKNGECACVYCFIVTIGHQYQNGDFTLWCYCDDDVLLEHYSVLYTHIHTTQLQGERQKKIWQKILII